MHKVIRILLSGIIGAIGALTVVDLQYETLIPDSVEVMLGQWIYGYRELIVFLLIFGIVYISLAGYAAKAIASKLEKILRKYSLQEILMYIIGFSIGIGIANLIVAPLMTSQSEILTLIWCGLLYVGLGYFGIYIVHIKKDEIRGWVSKKNQQVAHIPPKIMDTSVIIDGRILDIIRTKFIDGRIIIPSFVLDELRHVADSSDKLKRTRGRRGLDILGELQNLKEDGVEVMSIDYKDIVEVDVKLLKLTSSLQGVLITNDFNLNKVAKVQKVDVLNINDLANAIKPIVLPGEEMSITIAKEGKENEQGIAYLNDGTMIVVEGGKKYVGTALSVLVTKVLQTSAGRMIFAKILK